MKEFLMGLGLLLIAFGVVKLMVALAQRKKNEDQTSC